MKKKFSKSIKGIAALFFALCIMLNLTVNIDWKTMDIKLNMGQNVYASINTNTMTVNRSTSATVYRTEDGWTTKNVRGTFTIYLGGTYSLNISPHPTDTSKLRVLLTSSIGREYVNNLVYGDFMSTPLCQEFLVAWGYEILFRSPFSFYIIAGASQVYR